MIESVPSVAVPVSLMAQEVRPGAVALPSADQAMAELEVNAPCATPVSFRSPGQVALNDPFAVVPVCSVTSHLNAVQVLGVGMREEAEAQLPIRALLPPAEGEVGELVRSTPAQPAAAAATENKTTIVSFFIYVYPEGLSGEARPGTVAGDQKYNPPMSILKIARMGHPVLRAKARALHPSEIRSPKIQQLIDDMFETMKEYQGVGLAAPQVHEGLRLFVAGFPPVVNDEDDEDREDDEDEEDVPLMAVINPEIEVVTREVVEDWEGCLSIPDIRGRVPRARQITVRAYDRMGKKIEIQASGFTSRVIQHETDHLDGVLFFDRMKGFQSLTFLDEYGRYWTGRKSN